MIKIKPFIEHVSYCEQCHKKLKNNQILWQGIHVCVEMNCEDCGAHYIEDLPVGHATYFPYKVNLSEDKIFGEKKGLKWLGQPFLNSLKNPEKDTKINLMVNKKVSQLGKAVVVINTIDYLYGHSLLKLLNVQREAEENQDKYIVVIVQKALEWMVPEDVSEIWTVNISFKQARSYFPSLNDAINAELLRFNEIFISHAYSHPNKFNIEKFTRTLRYEESKFISPRISFIWREDRLWLKNVYVSKAIQKLGLTGIFLSPFLYIQKRKVISLFKKLKRELPSFQYTVVGLGQSCRFPNWINDERVSAFNKETELRICGIYSESKVVIGVHGSNMLLPSAHAEMVVDIMPIDRWGNFAQDILFQESEDSRLTSYKYRFIPIEINLKILSKIISRQINNYQHYKMQMSEDTVNNINWESKRLLSGDAISFAEQL
ncbi:hypothetical protein [Paenibacillus sp.]|uniref:hypothetical protein n=1 Tax=Paenibacillus sp. TaxID=58172 RepID=UPI002D61D655|nr:hypothetical protein [Paenibacillus sp.]HZG84926.1 hypothetical protein [Paenibacillus sp.]